MRVHVISDVHGAHEPLARAADGADALLCLGDLALFVDYDDPGRGVFADLFGPGAVSHWTNDSRRPSRKSIFAGWKGNPGSTG